MAPSGSVFFFGFWEAVLVFLIVVGIVFVVRQKKALVVLLFTISIPFTEEFVFEVGFTLTLAYIVASVALLLFLTNHTLGYQRFFFPKSLFSIIVFFLAIAGISLVFSVLSANIPYLAHSLAGAQGKNSPAIRGLTEWLRWGFVFLTIIVFYNFIDNQHLWRKVAHWHVLTCSVISLVSVLVLILTYGNLLPRNIANIVIEPRGIHVLRLSGFNVEATNFAYYLLTGCVFTLFFIMNREKILGRISPKICIVPQILAFVSTVSTTGLILICGIILASLINLISRSRSFKKKIRIIRTVFMFTIMILLFSVIASTFLFSKPLLYLQTEIYKFVTNSVSASASLRFAGFITDIRMFLEHPIFGVGIGNYPFFYNTYVPAWSPTKGFSGPETMFTGILSQTGILGFIIYLAFFIQCYRILKHACISSAHNESFSFFLHALFYITIIYLLGPNNFTTMYVIFVFIILLTGCRVTLLNRGSKVPTIRKISIH